VWGVAVVGTALVGGIVGLAALLVAAGAAVLAGRRRAATLGIPAGTALGVAGLLLLVAPADTTTARQVLAVLALAAVVAAALPLPHRPYGRHARSRVPLPSNGAS
jgi:arabinofuranan 3-O-arabinosyltransferase